jgi:hypothetical protein
MAVGLYGVNKLADVTIDDVDILYAYSPSREEIGDVQLRPLFNNGITNADLRKLIGADGMYKLRLPANVFNKLGYYSVLIKAKTFQTTILDCSYVVTNDNNQLNISKKGIVIPSLQFSRNNSLVGYQIEYFDTNGVKINNLTRIITSSDLVSQNVNNNTVNQGATTYVLDPAGTIIFLTLTPDQGSLISNNVKVDLGVKNQRILISNTFFDPFYVEIEMVDQTIKTLSYALYGNSSRDLQTGILTYFNDQNLIYKQYNLFTRKSAFEYGNIDVREQRSITNFNQEFSQISLGITE